MCVFFFFFKKKRRHRILKGDGSQEVSSPVLLSAPPHRGEGSRNPHAGRPAIRNLRPRAPGRHHPSPAETADTGGDPFRRASAGFERGPAGRSPTRGRLALISLPWPRHGTTIRV